jgi:hypothetical protein
MPAPPSVPRSAPAITGPGATPGPKKETARIGLLAAAAAKAGAPVEMKKTQPLVTMPSASKQTAHLSVTPTAAQLIASDGSMAFYWALLGISTVILIIQIWNYFV